MVAAVAAIPAGTPLARLDTAVGRRAGWAGIPAGRPTSTCVRDWPRSVTIVVRERVPAAVQRTRDGVRARRPRPAWCSTTVDRPADRSCRWSARRSSAGPPRRCGPRSTCSTALPAAVRGSGAARCARRAPDEVTLQLSRGRTVVWGEPETGRRARPRSSPCCVTRKADVYDVSVPGRPDHPQVRRTAPPQPPAADADRAGSRRTRVARSGHVARTTSVRSAACRRVGR